MSSGGNHGGSRTRMGTKVYLNIYDLSPANDYLYPIGFGLHHSGVEVMGSEYTFASGAGVFEAPQARDAPGARYRDTLELGAFDGGMAEFNKALADVRQTFGPDDYHLIRKNCNHFANALVWRLLGRQIPAHVNRLADLGVCCSCLLPKEMLEHAPVGDTTATAGRSSSSSNGFFGVGAVQRQATASTSSTPVFTGSGARLGSAKSDNAGIAARLLGSGRSPSPRTEDLTDRRERIRQAALARLEQQKYEQHK